MLSLVITNIWQKVNDVWWNLFTPRYSCNTAIKVGVKHQLINQSITQTYQKQVLKVEQCIDLITVFNIYTVVGTMYWDKI
jgi:hypothetical protein